MINAGSLDRAVRIVFGLAMLSLTVIGPGSYYGLVGIVPLVTGLMGFCPLYRLAGVRTCPAPAPRPGRRP